MMLAAFCLSKPAKEGRACFELRKVPKPTLKGLPPGSVLLAVLACSICGSDLWGKNEETGRRPTDFIKAKDPLCGGSGHELIGQVVDIVEPCSLLQVGQRVLALSPAYIKRIQTVRAAFEGATKESANILPDLGGFVQYAVSHASVCFPLPQVESKSLPRNPLHFVAGQPLGTLICACKKLGSVMGHNVAIVGQGPNGLMMTQMLANLGARRIIALDLLEERLKVSQQCKATHTIKCASSKGNPNESFQDARTKVAHITEGAMCDVVVEMVGHQGNTIDLCAMLAKDGGTVLLFGLPPGSDEPGMMIRPRDFTRSIRFICSHSPSMEDFALAVEMIKQGRFDPSPVFSLSIPFERFPEAYEMASEYKDGVSKILLTF